MEADGTYLVAPHVSRSLQTELQESDCGDGTKLQDRTALSLTQGQQCGAAGKSSLRTGLVFRFPLCSDMEASLDSDIL